MIKKLLLVGIFGFQCASMSPAQADPAVVGYIGAAAAQSVSGVVASRGAGHDRFVLELDSPGGSISSAHALATRLEALAPTTRVVTRVDRRCWSACVLVALAGEERVAKRDATYGFHAIHNARTKAVDRAYTGWMLQKFIKHGVAPDWIRKHEHCFKTVQPGCLFKAQDLLEAGFVTRLM